MEPKKLNLIASPEKSIPKFATNVNIGKLQNGDIILAFMFQMGQQPVPAEGDLTATLIESIIVDETHAKKIVELLDKVIKTEVPKIEAPK